jgi:hypothetical protein
MIDRELQKQQFTQDNIPTRLGKLANQLNRIYSLSHDSTQADLVKSLINESRYFIEWTAPEMDIDLAAELVDLMRFLTRWLAHWEEINNDNEVKNQTSQQLTNWTERVLQISELSANLTPQ